MYEVKFRVWLENIDMPGSNEQMIYSNEVGLITFWRNYEAWRGKKYLMLYTGQKDKNDNEIYEDDIVKWNEYDPINHEFIESRIGKVIFEDSMFGVKTIDPYGNLNLAIIIHLEDLEVIGNIYENPELLK